MISFLVDRFCFPAREGQVKLNLGKDMTWDLGVGTPIRRADQMTVDGGGGNSMDPNQAARSPAAPSDGNERTIYQMRDRRRRRCMALAAAAVVNDERRKKEAALL